MRPVSRGGAHDKGSWLSNNTGAIFSVFVLFVAALCAGVAFSANMGAEQTENLSSFYNDLRIFLSGKEVDFVSIYYTALSNNVKYLFLMCLLGFVIVGAPLVAMVCSVKAFLVGFALGTLYSIYGSQGITLSLGGVLLQNMITIPLLMIYAVYCMKFSAKLYGSVRRERGYKDEFIKNCASYAAVFAAFVIALAAASFIECFLVTVFS